MGGEKMTMALPTKNRQEWEDIYQTQEFCREEVGEGERGNRKNSAGHKMNQSYLLLIGGPESRGLGGQNSQKKGVPADSKEGIGRKAPAGEKKKKKTTSDNQERGIKI